MSDESPKDKAKNKPDDGIVSLGEHVEILTLEREKKFDAGVVMAYSAKAVGLEDPAPLVALVCRRDLMPREGYASKYEAIAGASMMPLMARGEIDWPGEKQRRYAFVYKVIAKDPMAKASQVYSPNKDGVELDPAKPISLGLKPEWVHANVILPMSRLLLDFRDKDFEHGRINIHNLYSHIDPSVHKIILGECLCCPPSFAQPFLYEPPERAMADPIGRGLGTPADDLYAFGVCLAIMLRKSDPMANMRPNEILRHKLEVGSCNALTEGERFSGPILELLRGLLNDDLEVRWDIDSLLAWIDGRRLSPKQAHLAHGASRPITFAGNRYLRPDFMAMKLAQNPDKLDAIIDNGELNTWITRALEDDALFLRAEKNIAQARKQGRGTGYIQRLACYTSIALDPKAPIRYGSISVNPEGIGIALASAMVCDKNLNDFGQILSCGIVLNWIASQEGLLTGLAALGQKFDDCRTYIRNKKVGYGIERCLYILDPECFCLSPNFSHTYVHTPQDMLLALEELCKSGNPPATLLDRHCVAFLAVHDKSSVESFLFDLNATDHHSAFMGSLACIASLQKRTGIAALPHIAKEAVARLANSYENYHDRSLRAQIEKNINTFAKEGKISRIVSLLSNEKLIHQDKIGLRRAQRDYNNISREYQMLSEQMQHPATFGRKSGSQVGAISSAIISGIIILVTAFVYMADKSIFPIGAF